jgi:hypothetical protein
MSRHLLGVLEPSVVLQVIVMPVRQAATRLHLSRPPLSKQIHDLQDEIGTKLFGRGKSGMRLPPVNQGTVGSENDRNFSTQRNLLEGGTINQTGKKNSNSAKEAVYTAT